MILIPSTAPLALPLVPIPRIRDSREKLHPSVARFIIYWNMAVKKAAPPHIRFNQAIGLDQIAMQSNGYRLGCGDIK
jgi:hypothetical protein